MNDRLWALAPELAEGVFEVYRQAQAPQSGQSPAQPVHLASEPDVASFAAQMTRMVGAVAVISITGPIDRVTRYSCWSGQVFAVGQDVIKAAITQAVQNPSVGAVLLSFNSPGGVVAGTKELADYIASLRDVKPFASYANGLAASGAYWLASATGRVFAPVTGQVGSIGVIMEVADLSGFYRTMGIDLQYIASGKWKVAGREAHPLTDEERSYFQERISALHAVFRDDVAAHMRVAAPPEQWAEAQILLASQAREVGLVSAVVRDEDAAVATLMEVSMPNLTREALAKDAPELLAAIKQEGRAEAEAEAKAKAEAGIKDSLAAAAKGGKENALAAMRLVCSAESVSAVSALLEKTDALQLTPEQLAGVAALLPKAEPSAANNSGAEGRTELLAALQKAHEPPVGQDGNKAVKGSLVADAERRAKVVL